MKNLFVLFITAGGALCATPQVSIPLVFEKNAGQVDPSVRFFSRTPHAALWLTESEAVLSVDKKDRREVLRMRLDGAQRHPAIEGARPLESRSNYFIGRDPAAWKTDVPQYAAVRYREVYPGIDLLFHADAETLEYDWIVQPGADPRRIRVAFEGAKAIRIYSSGDLVLFVGRSQVREKRPHIYQQGDQEIPGRWVRRGRSYGFEIGDYDPARPLTIDPILTYATHLGGSANTSGSGDAAYAVAVDSQGNVIVAGVAYSSNFPAKNAIQAAPEPKEGENGFIAKINPSGAGASSLIWSTYFGGNNATFVNGVTVDAQNNVYIAGQTGASNMPLVNAFQSAFNTASTCVDMNGAPSVCVQGFFAKIASAGSQLMYSSYLGGLDGDNEGLGIAVDSTGSAWVAGATGASNFPLAGSYAQGRLGGAGAQNGFVSKVSPDGSQLVYSTYLGGNNIEYLFGIAVDSAGNAYVSGATLSTDFPTTTNAYQPAMPAAAIENGVVAKINPNGAPSLVYSTYLNGTKGGSLFNGVAVDSKGNIYVAGQTSATDFPVTSNAIQTGKVIDGGGTGGVIAELNPSAPGTAQLVYGTLLSGGISDAVEGIAVDKTGRIIVAGYTQFPGFPTTPDAFQLYFGKYSSATGAYTNMSFLSIVNPADSGSQGLVYSTLFGGTAGDLVFALGLDPTGTIAAIAGGASSSDMFTTANAYQPSLADPYGDAFVAVFNLAQSGPLINNMLNAASYDTTTVYAPGEIVAVFGSNIGPQTIVGAELNSAGQLATTLAGCQLLVNGVAAPLVYAQASVLAAILPYELTPRISSGLETYAQVVCNGVAGNTFQFSTGAAQPGIFSASSNGTGQAAVFNADGTLNSATNPAAEGSIVSFYATGEGVLSPAGQDGRIETGGLSTIPKPVLPLTVSFGGVASPNIAYAGVAPGEVDGLLQINAQIPTGLPAGGVALTITLGSASSQKNLTIAVH
jgi:uncharacterized protein (TIGR03437 family)